MKRVGYIYEKIINVDNCKQAIIEASRHKRRRPVVQKVLLNLDFYANDLSKRLKELNFISPYTEKVIQDKSCGKIRTIYIPNFYPDQCAHHAIIQILEPIILKSSCNSSCANIPGRGMSRASVLVTRATIKDQKYSKYCLKCDIKKFYPSINHKILKECLQRKIKDKKALEIIYTVIDSHDEGLPIGNYTSPWLAELFLMSLDNLIKQEFRVKYYIRYADDIVIIGNNKKKLKILLNAIIKKLRELGLKIKENYQIFRIKMNHQNKGRKIDFIGKCYGRGFTTIRKSRALKFMRHSRKIQKQQKEGKAISFYSATGFISRSAC